ncbi:MAG: cbb3-type cytochrome c oxidase subunit I [Planctomycetes bacterium]|nr:cbb3-type cytochrome c oxidase subunit I [Planctomycetota bacterium]
MDDHIHPEPTSFISKYIFSHDHKVIAKQFIFLGLFGLLFGGVMAMIIRWTIAYPGEPFPVLGKLLFSDTNGLLSNDRYAMFFTMHGTIMIFFAITPILIGGFGNFTIPLMIGARDMAFPTLNMLSFWAYFVSVLFLAGSFFVPGGASAGGWVAYPPLASTQFQAGWGHTFWLFAIYFVGASSTMGAINYITTVIRLRAPGMGWFDMPLTIWGLWLTAVLNALFLPVLTGGAILMILDRVAGTHFYTAASLGQKGGDPILWQHLFWIFGHPEVYILILPAWGIVSDLLSFFSRKPAFGYRVTACAMIAITILSALVYGHHMFTTGMSPMLSESFQILTMIISIPAAIFFENWLHTIWHGQIRLATPMLFSLGLVFVFGLGGLSGLYLGSIATDLYLHDTYFVVGHFHLTMAAAVLFGSFAAIYFWFPKMFGRMMNDTLGKIHFWLSVVPLTAVFVGMLIVGYAGHHRRTPSLQAYEYLKPLQQMNVWITVAALSLGAAQVLFIINFFMSLFAGPKAPNNPWGVGTLEWMLPSPPKYYNFEKIPNIYYGPHEYGNPSVKDRDWVGQWEDPKNPGSGGPNAH